MYIYERDMFVSLYFIHHELSDCVQDWNCNSDRNCLIRFDMDYVLNT